MEEGRKELPNSTAVLVLGILSIVFCWCYGVPGIVMGTIALVLSSQSAKHFNTNPDSRVWIGYGNMQAGKVCAIIGLCLSALFLAYVVIQVAIVGISINEIITREYQNLI